MKKFALLISLLLIHFLFIVGAKTIYSNTFSTSTQSTISSINQRAASSDTSLLNYANYLLLKKYILENGKSEQVNISSLITKPKYITYHILKFKEWRLTVDHSARIYCSILTPENVHLGNVLADDSKGILIETDKEEYRTQIKNMLNQLVQMMHQKQ